MKQLYGLLLSFVIATPVSAASPAKPPAPPPVTVPFSASASFGQDVNILTHGPITLFLRCRANVQRLDTGTLVDVASLNVVSSVSEMLSTTEHGVLIPAGLSRVVFAASVLSPGESRYIAPDDAATHANAFHENFNGSGASAITPDGTVLNVPADTVGFGIGVARFSGTVGWADAPDCFVTGVAMLFARQQ